jgi:hypothetical protein
MLSEVLKPSLVVSRDRDQMYRASNLHFTLWR